MNHPIVLAITGASGAVYAGRLLELLLAHNHPVHLSISESGRAVLKQELDLSLDLRAPDLCQLLTVRPAWWNEQGTLHVHDQAIENLHLLKYHHHQDYLTPIASGSFLTRAMVICPCSGSTLSGIAHANSSNLIVRAADVHLKERRKLIVVPRETPLSSLQIENLLRVSQAGGIVLPAMPGFYHEVRGAMDLVDFVVARILDQLGIEHQLMRRWGQPE